MGKGGLSYGRGTSSRQVRAGRETHSKWCEASPCLTPLFLAVTKSFALLRARTLRRW